MEINNLDLGPLRDDSDALSNLVTAVYQFDATPIIVSLVNTKLDEAGDARERLLTIHAICTAIVSMNPQQLAGN